MRIGELFNIYNTEIPIEQHTGSVYHYTSPSGLLGITKDNIIRASDRLFLNDTSEANYIYKVLESNKDNAFKDCKELQDEILKEIKRINKKEMGVDVFHIYTISFSMNNDSLNMWNYYSKGEKIQGYNIEFDTKQLTDNIKIKIEDIKMNNGELKNYHGMVVYDVQMQLDKIEQVMKPFVCIYQNHKSEFTDRALKNTFCYLLARKLFVLGRFFKPKCFLEEEEYRVLYSTMLIKDLNFQIKGIPSKELFRENNGVILPFVECVFSKDSMRGVKISPTIEKDTAILGVKRLLHNYDYNIAEKAVSVSEIPVRY